jgi:probable rRNA maturation factor
MISKTPAAKMKKSLCKAQVLNSQRKFKILSTPVSSFCGKILQSLGRPGHSLSVVFINSTRMREINRRYRGKDSPTDVLSFRYHGETFEGMPFLGEVVISPEIANRNAAERGIAFDAEIRTLLLHGILHLTGYDHETDKGEMNRLQKLLQRRRVFLDSTPMASVKGRR